MGEVPLGHDSQAIRDFVWDQIGTRFGDSERRAFTQALQTLAKDQSVSLQILSTTDGAEVDGAWVAKGDYEHFDLLVAYEAVLAQDETLQVLRNLQHADDDQGAGAEDLSAAIDDDPAATGGAGGSTETGILVNESITQTASPLKDYVRAQTTLNTSGAGTVTFMVVLVMHKR